MKLSILICSVNNRVDNFLQNIYKQINEQLIDDVEVLCIIDNQTMTIGTKRNRLVEMAKGEYIVFVDDDDKISDNYVEQLIKGIESGKDVICFDANISINGGEYKLVKYSIEYDNFNTNNAYYRKPNHLMCWKASLAKVVKYLDISFGEDTQWGLDMAMMVENEHQIKDVLYYYDYNDGTSESIKYKS